MKNVALASFLAFFENGEECPVPDGQGCNRRVVAVDLRAHNTFNREELYAEREARWFKADEGR